jgi:hypothetical protein
MQPKKKKKKEMFNKNVQVRNKAKTLLIRKTISFLCTQTLLNEIPILKVV